jgi:hypothetical protein
MKDINTVKKQWCATARKWLVGYTVTNVGYSNEEDWCAQSLCLQLERNGNKILLVPQADDEGNDGGALYVINKSTGKDEILPVIWTN